ncbi:MAG: hypothetical protein R3B13_40625 [Polyangiaceae bacterium]
MATAVARRQSRPKRAAPEIPVASGWFWFAAAMVGAMVVIPFSPIGNWIAPKPPENHNTATWQVGSTGKVRVTLITADFGLLSCAAESEVDGTHCLNKSETEAWPADPSQPLDDNKANVIQPFRTWPDNELIMIAGLWAEPNMALRVHREPSAGVASNKLSRFVAECEVKFIGTIKQPKLRWNPGGPWQPEGSEVVVARPISCTIDEA